jgi:hypothetical protein
MKKFFELLILIQYALWGGNILAQESIQSSSFASQPTGLQGFAQQQLASGLKEALSKGLQQAVAELGHEGGFLTNLYVRIPMPQQLHTLEKTLRSLGQQQLADEFVAAMNHAAEQAVPEAATVFGDALSKMTIADAATILAGPTDAATAYFRRATETNLFERFLPVVKRTTEATGATATYKRILDQVNGNKYVGSLLGAVLTPESLDLDGYITHRAMDGLFKIVADEEKRIRQNPVARTSELLRKVFGALER